MQTPDGKDDGAQSGRPLAKKAYTAPTLVEWGTLRDMTRMVGQSGSPDGGPRSSHMTSTH
jgi:hypothetical protein